MRSFQVRLNPKFIGRERELRSLHDIVNVEESSIVVVYGRRRVGKTELIEQAFRDKKIMKFEGIEGYTTKIQQEHVLRELAKYAEEPLFSKTRVSSWTEVFEMMWRYLQNGQWILYFEELQWLANYEDKFIAELKYAWDNFFRFNPKLVIVLCGSSPSFMINHVLKSKSLYNRSMYELSLRQFNIIETRQFLHQRSVREVMDAYLTIGGIPEYLKWVNRDSSVFLSLCKNSFISGAFFAHEYKRIFISSMAKNKHYQKIIEFLAKKRFANRDEILKHLNLAGGGTISSLLMDLQLCNFIKKYVPFNLEEESKLARFCISDNYLQFYYNFIKPHKAKIENGDYDDIPISALKTESYYKWLGYAFERFCRTNHRLFAKILGFGAVNYRCGSYFSRKADMEQPGYQIDLIYDRDDRICTICEVKYLQSKIGTSVIEEFAKKLSLFPNPKNKTIHKVLIAPEGAEQALINRAYFDQIITFDDIFASERKS